MKQLVTTGIVLSRTDFGEADRIVTFLTPDYGKLRLMARGVRKVKSKLAGGIELFSISSLTFIQGRGEIGTLISVRLDRHYGSIVKDIDRVQFGYELIKILNKATEDQPEAEYFELLEQAFEALNDATIELPLIRFWFNVQLLQLAGHAPNLRTDMRGDQLMPEKNYSFDVEAMIFTENMQGKFAANQIKLLRLAFAGNPPSTLGQIQNLGRLLVTLQPLVQTMLTSYIRV